jgi:hypothetical protein
MYTSKAALLVQNIKEYSIIMKFANFLEVIFSSKYLVYSFIRRANNQRFFSFKTQETVWCFANITD